jgi:hypothetical protein
MFQCARFCCQWPVFTSYRRAIAADATSLEAPTGMPYGDRRAMRRVASGNAWQIATHKEDLLAHQMCTRMDRGNRRLFAEAGLSELLRCECCFDERQERLEFGAQQRAPDAFEFIPNDRIDTALQRTDNGAAPGGKEL